MKKKLTLVLALCACFAFSAAFTACEKEEAAPASSPAASSPADSTPTTSSASQVTETQWAAAFGFDNVTMEYYLVSGETANLYQTFYLDGNKALVGEDGEMFEMTSSYLTWLREIADFSGFYADFTYDSEKKAYFVASKDVLGDGSFIYENMYITFANGKVASCSATVKETKGEKTNTYGILVKFKDYGTTKATLEDPDAGEMPISREDWASAFDASKFTNITTTAKFSIEGIGNIVETLSYANGNERVEVIFPDESMNGIAELYFVEDAWYLYYTQTGEVQPEDGTYMSFTAISGMLKQFIVMGASMYDFMEYDEETGELWLNSEGVELRFTIVDGVLLSYSIDMGTVYTFTFSKQGETSFEVPFELQQMKT